MSAAAPISIWRGFYRDTEVACEVEDLGAGVGRTVCPECEGTGDWTRFHPEPHLLLEPLQCVECKGTGLILVSVA